MDISLLWSSAKNLARRSDMRRTVRIAAFYATLIPGAMFFGGSFAVMGDAFGILDPIVPEACRVGAVMMIITPPLMLTTGLGSMATAMHITGDPIKSSLSKPIALIAGAATGAAGLFIAGIDLKGTAEMIGILKSSIEETCQLQGGAQILAPTVFLLCAAGSIATAKRLLTRALGLSKSVSPSASSRAATTPQTTAPS